MTQEEKAKAYDEAIEKLRDFYRDYDTVSCLIDVKEELANLFPVLKESEDERIKKTLINFFSKGAEYDSSTNGIKDRNIIAWLEKQGEQSDANGCFCTNNDYVGNSNSTNISPATKEQRDLLFQKMKEDGYEWDYEKKELEYNGEDYGIDSLWHAKNILEKTLGKVDGYQTDDGILGHKCAIAAVNKLYKQKSAVWSEVDERHRQWILECLVDGKRKVPEYAEDYQSAFDWLKSLRPNHWKPSKEQMKQLGWIAKQNKDNMIGKELISLYQDLKKLKGE